VKAVFFSTFLQEIKILSSSEGRLIHLAVTFTDHGPRPGQMTSIIISSLIYKYHPGKSISKIITTPILSAFEMQKTPIPRLK